MIRLSYVRSSQSYEHRNDWAPRPVLSWDMSWIQRFLDQSKPRRRQKDLAAHLGIPPERVSEMVNGRRRVQQTEYEGIASFFGISQARVAALAAGKPDPGDLAPELGLRHSARTSAGSHPPTPNVQPILPDDRTLQAPLEVWASAEGGEEGAMLITTGPIDYIPRPGGLPARGAFAVYLIGDSMSPAYEHGDQLYINPLIPVRSGVDCLFIHEQEDGTLLALAKRLVRPTADKWRVKQFNPPREFDLDRRKWGRAWMVAGKMSRT